MKTSMLIKIWRVAAITIMALLLFIAGITTAEAQRNVKVTQSFQYTATNPDTNKVLTAVDERGYAAWSGMRGLLRCADDSVLTNSRAQFVIANPNSLNLSTTECDTVPYLFVDTIAYNYNDGRPYSVYTALLNQTDTFPPVATVLENTIGLITWSRIAEGAYAANSVDSLFTTNKTGFFIMPASNYFRSGYIMTNELTTTELSFTFIPTVGILKDDYLINTLIEIRVYK